MVSPLIETSHNTICCMLSSQTTSTTVAFGGERGHEVMRGLKQMGHCLFSHCLSMWLLWNEGGRQNKQVFKNILNFDVPVCLRSITSFTFYSYNRISNNEVGFSAIWFRSLKWTIRNRSYHFPLFS